MIKISIEYEGSASRFRRELMELLDVANPPVSWGTGPAVMVPMNLPANEAGVAPSAPVDGDRLEVPEGIEITSPGPSAVTVAELATAVQKEAEQPVRKKRRSKAEMEAAASPEPPQAAEPAPEERVSKGITYWLDNDKAEVFTLQDGEALPDADLIADKAIEQLNDEAEFKVMQARIERLKVEEPQGPASKLEAEVEQEMKAEEGETVLRVAGRILEVFDDEVEAASTITDIVTKVGKADKIKNIDPSRAPDVIVAMKKAIAAEKERKAAVEAKAAARGRR